MRSITMSKRRATLGFLLLGSAVFGTAQAQAATVAPCASAATSTVFSPWGDGNQYAPFQGSSFESGASGWSWAGKANIVSGDDDHALIGGASHAVNLPAGATARSPWTCVDSTRPSLRFFVRRISGTAPLTVAFTVAGAGKLVSTISTIDGTSVWEPSAPVVFPSWLIDSLSAGSLNAQFQFTAGADSVYRIDDVYIDPFKFR